MHRTLGRCSLMFCALAVTFDVNGQAVPGGAGPEGLTAADWEGIQAAYSVVQQAYLKASNTGAGDRFGFPVAVSGDTVVVGAALEDSGANTVNGNQVSNGATDAGAAYVFVRKGAGWSQQAYLKPSNTGAGDRFGWSVAISGDTVVVGAEGEASTAPGVNGDQTDDSAPFAGAAYVFVRDGTTWTQQAYLKASSPDASDRFGNMVGLSDDIIVVGAYTEGSGATGVAVDQDDDSAPSAGAAYVFVRDAQSGVWSQQAYLKASNTDANDWFGAAVAVSGETVVVGARTEDSGATGVNGDDDDDSVPNAGAAYVFVRNGTTWSQQAYLKASNTEVSDDFGYDVDVSGDTLVVSAFGDDSSATGVNGDQGDNGTSASGAAYVFVRDPQTQVWNQQAYLKASNTGVWYTFGVAVALSGNTLVVGSSWEDSGTTGVNGDQGDTSASTSGAAYVFDLQSWSDEGFALAGVLGEPLLVGTGPLADGTDNALALSYAAPSAPCVLFVALASTPTPFKGGTLKPFPLLVDPLSLVTSPSGTLQVGFRMPPGVPPATDIWWQFGIVDIAAPLGVALSNAIKGVTS